VDKQIAQFFPLILLFGVFYFFLIRPQQKADKQRRDMLAAIKKGDRIISVGGLIGTIVDILDDRVKLRIADKVEVELSKSGIAAVRE
jgi:preprotein translocase subunit YajC